VHAEFAGWYRKRLKDLYTLVGLVDGELGGFRERPADERGHQHQPAHDGTRARRPHRRDHVLRQVPLRLRDLGNNEFWATYESYNGWHRWGLGMAQPSYPWPDVQHELGGARVYYVTRRYWDSMVKNYLRQMVGAELVFDVPDTLVQANAELRIPADVAV
jgi:hypothetical protein